MREASALFSVVVFFFHASFCCYNQIVLLLKLFSECVERNQCSFFFTSKILFIFHLVENSFYRRYFGHEDCVPYICQSLQARLLQTLTQTIVICGIICHSQLIIQNRRKGEFHSKIFASKCFLFTEKYGIYPGKTSTSSPVEEIIIDAAKQLPYYFCRFYKVSVRRGL